MVQQSSSLIIQQKFPTGEVTKKKKKNWDVYL